MNPVYPGKDVSYIDTKQAQRAAEIAVRDGERLATLAWLAGAGYPAESLDKAWRQLVFGAHHDAITGTESDQVYLDLLGGWREAWQRGDQARRDAAGELAGAGPIPAGPGQRALVVFNTLSWPRSGLVSTELEFAAPGAGVDRAARRGGGGPVPGRGRPRRHPDGTPGRGDAHVPRRGRARAWATGPTGSARRPGGRAGAQAGWAAAARRACIENDDRFLVEADPARGGTLTRLVDKRAGAELLRPGRATS